MRFTQVLIFISALLVMQFGLISCTSDVPYEEWDGWASLSKEQQAFFAAFYSDSVFQKGHVLFPLESQWIEEDNNTLTEIVRIDHVNREDYSFLDLTDGSYYGEFIDINYNDFQLLLRQVDTGVYVIFEFANIGGSWLMTKVNDSST